MKNKKTLQIVSYVLTGLGFGLGFVTNVVDNKMREMELKDEVAAQLSELLKKAE